jgi:hypothetical protein
LNDFMPSGDPRYQNGSEVHAGDVVSYDGQKGAVVFVADRQEYSDAYPEADWPSMVYPTGFMIEFANGGRLLLESSDEHLELLSRAATD